MNRRSPLAAVVALVALAGCSGHAPSAAPAPSSSAPLPDPTPSPMSAASADDFPVRHMSFRETKPTDTTAHVTLDDGAAVPASTYTVDVPLDGQPAPIKPGSKCITTPTAGSVCIVKAQTTKDRQGLPVVSVWVTSSQKGGQCEFAGHLTPGRPYTRTCSQAAQ